jgi:hypothetical protein
MFVQEFLNIERPATDSELYIHTYLRNVRIRAMNCFVQRKKKLGKKQLSRTFLNVYKRGDKRERKREREREMRE